MKRPTVCVKSYSDYTGSLIKDNSEFKGKKAPDVVYDCVDCICVFTNAGSVMLGEASRTFAGEATDGVDA